MPITLANTINGNGILAARATADASGNSFDSTYATKTELSGKQGALTAQNGLSLVSNTIGIKPTTDINGINNSGLGFYNDPQYYTLQGSLNHTTQSQFGSDCFKYAGINSSVWGSSWTINGPFNNYSNSGVYLLLVQGTDASSISQDTPWAVSKNSVTFTDGSAEFEYSFDTSGFDLYNSFSFNDPFMMLYANTNSWDSIVYYGSTDIFTWSTSSLDWNAAGLLTDTDYTVSSVGVYVDANSVKTMMNLATVASSGSYNDLSNRPSIPDTKPVVAGANVTITEGANDITIAATGTTYTAGNMITINAANSNAIGVSTTAGITDIQRVNALPASPVSTVLYLIPEN